jgi:hypothetical protein
MNARVSVRHPRAGQSVIVLGGEHIGQTFEIEDWASRVLTPPAPMLLEAERLGDPYVYGHVGTFGGIVLESHLGPKAALS